MKPEEKLREMLRDYASAEENSAATGASPHLRDEDFIRLLENISSAKTTSSMKINGNFTPHTDNLAPLRQHLANCEPCLIEFKDYYAFFAPAESGEAVAKKSEIDAAWKDFSPRIIPVKESPSFWARIFSSERKFNSFAAFGWGFATLLLLLSGISIFIAWQARNEKSQIAGEFENQKRTYEERLKTLEQSASNRDLAEQDKNRLTQEKDDLQKRIASLETEIEKAKQIKPEREKIPTPTINQSVPDNSLVAVNTPIYDVFPSDSTVRGTGDDSQNKLAVPNAAKNIVLILSAAGRNEFATYQAEIVNNAGKTIWRGGGLRKDNLGNFTLSLSRAALKTGNYRVRLFGKDRSGSLQKIAEYPITINVK